jgi:hypothetical protein
MKGKLHEFSILIDCFALHARENTTLHNKLAQHNASANAYNILYVAEFLMIKPLSILLAVLNTCISAKNYDCKIFEFKWFIGDVFFDCFN